MVRGLNEKQTQTHPFYQSMETKNKQTIYPRSTQTTHHEGLIQAYKELFYSAPRLRHRKHLSYRSTVQMLLLHSIIGEIFSI